MAKSAKERMREMRLRKKNGIPVVFKHEPPAVRVRAYRLRGGDELREKELLNQKIRRQKIKITILTYYGNGKRACVRCGEGRIECLSIDHINGGGSQHLKSMKTPNLYGWLMDNNLPPGFQTLCMNCQFIKRYENGEHRKRCNKVQQDSNILATSSIGSNKVSGDVTAPSI